MMTLDQIKIKKNIALNDCLKNIIRIIFFHKQDQFETIVIRNILTES